MSRRTAVYAGTFDVLTLGHVWMIQQGSALFDNLVVAIRENPGKHPMFSLADRVNMLHEVVASLPNVKVDSFTNRYLIAYAEEINASFILRGVRNQNDYEYEHAMRNINSDMAPGITTVLLMPPRELSEVSSSLVKGLIGPDGWEDVVSRYVPERMLVWLKAR